MADLLCRAVSTVTSWPAQATASRTAQPAPGSEPLSGAQANSQTRILTQEAVIGHTRQSCTCAQLLLGARRDRPQSAASCRSPNVARHRQTRVMWPAKPATPATHAPERDGPSPKTDGDADDPVAEHGGHAEANGGPPRRDGDRIV